MADDFDGDFWDTPRVQDTFTKFFFKINEYFEMGKYTDVTITCEDRVFKCHRLVLAAASEYFNGMFGGNFQESRVQDVALHDIDSSIFELALRYMYTGSLYFINDENVYDLLRAAGILNLDCIEERCIHYLTERNVPTDFALEIFSHACIIRKRPLLSCVSQCILQNLSHFSENSEFLALSFDELSTLLEFGLPDGSYKRENVLLRTIYQWVSHLTCSCEEKKTSFLKLTENIRFRCNPVEFFDGFNQAEFQTEGDTDLQVKNHNSTFYVYVNSKDDQVGDRTHLYKYNEDGGWHDTGVVGSVFYDMRTVVIDNRLYCLQLLEKEFSFISSSSVDLFADRQSLAVPPLVAKFHFYICGHKGNIFACSPDVSNTLFKYNCELDKWFDIEFMSYSSEEFPPVRMTLCHNQLYLLGGKKTTEARSYDYRTGKLEVLPQCKLDHSYFTEICSHKEKMYVSSLGYDSESVEVYNPVANKWSVFLDKTWADENDGISFIESHRLVSFDNKLFIFMTKNIQDSLLDDPHGFYEIQCYDSWIGRRDSNREDMYNSNFNWPINRTAGDNTFIADVIVYETL